MFYSAVNPGILQVGMGGADNESTSQEERASVTVDKPVESQVSSDNAASQIRAISTVAQLYEQFRRPIHSYIYRLLGNQEDADDVTQEVFVRACTSWNGLYERERLSPWLYRIATNLCVDMLRRRKRISWWSLSHRYHNDDYSEEEASEDTFAFLADSGGIPEIAERDLIRRVLANLPPEYATALVLSAAQGISYQEIATIMGISPNASATRISRAKRMFIEHYQRLNKDGGNQEKAR
ncbi:MAG: RNA polymerase sigma factor [Ktedonobacteraceae bacterium]